MKDDTISRSDAIRVASGYCHWSNIPKELAKLPSVNPIPCNDAISRQAAIGIIQSWLGSDTGYSWGEKNVMLCTIDQLRELPSVRTEKTGYWIKIKPYPLQMHDYECSECGHETDDNTEKYCSGCGARMIEPKMQEVEE